MAIIVFILVLVLSVVLAVLSVRGKITSNMNELMTASGSFGAFLMFFLSVGEIYSIGTLIGTPGAIYSKGASYVVWFIIYILLAYPIGYFINPLIRKLGKLSNGSTVSDLIGWRFNSKGVQVVTACVAIGFCIPWVQNQFSGMTILYKYLNLGLTPIMGIIISIILAFVYIAVAGIKAPAWVSVLKDVLLIGAIIIVGSVCIAKTNGGVAGVFDDAIKTAPETLTIESAAMPFTITTIIFNMLGFYCLPFTLQGTLTSKSGKILRKNSIYMPLYMIMMPFLVITAYFAVSHYSTLELPDHALLAVAVDNLPSWVVGLIAGGGALTAILVMAFVALCVGGLFSKNILGVIKPDMNDKTMSYLTKLVTLIFLVASGVVSIYIPSLMLGLIALSYTGLGQMFVSLFLGFTWKRATKWGVICGLLGSMVFIFAVPVMPYGMSKGFIAILINFALTIGVSLMTKPDSVTMARFEQLKGNSEKIAKLG